MTREQSIFEMAEKIKAQQGAILVGSGASLAAGLPNWKQLMIELVERLQQIPGIDTGLVDSCRRMAEDRAKWLLLASVLRRHMGSTFPEYINDRFCNVDLEPTETHRAIAELPVRFFVTINYDDLIESAFSEKHLGKRRVDPITYDKPGDIASYFYKGSPFVLYCHGRARTDADKVVLSESDYRSLIQAQIGYQSILQTLFTTTSFLFVGTSLNDPDIIMLLGFLHSAFHRKTPPHYALIPDNERETAEVNQFFHDFKLNAITLPSANFGDEVIKYLRELKDASI